MSQISTFMFLTILIVLSSISLSLQKDKRIYQNRTQTSQKRNYTSQNRTNAVNLSFRRNYGDKTSLSERNQNRTHSSQNRTHSGQNRTHTRQNRTHTSQNRTNSVNHLSLRRHHGNNTRSF